MPRKTPNCAYCGEPLKDTDCQLRQFPNVAGKPEVGWHGFDADSCAAKDELHSKFPAADGMALVRQLLDIEARGPNRLVANMEWKRLNSAT